MTYLPKRYFKKIGIILNNLFQSRETIWFNHIYHIPNLGIIKKINFNIYQRFYG